MTKINPLIGALGAEIKGGDMVRILNCAPFVAFFEPDLVAHSVARPL